MTVTPNPRIIDSTLREGRQAPGVSFGPACSIEIAENLIGLGVDMVECGHPSVSLAEAAHVKAVVDICGDVPTLAHARARTEDVEAVKESGAPWVGIFAGVNSISRSTRINSASIPDLIRSSVSHAKNLGLNVRFTVEDASRTDWDDLMTAYRAAIDCGADRICFADTVGILLPWEVEETISGLIEKFATVPVEVHFHDDRGMANANALVAVRAGAAWVSSSVNGIGERSGITDTLTLMVNLAAQNFRAFPNGDRIQHTSKVVQAHSRMQADRWRPTIGRNAFSHTARLHRLAASKDWKAYSWLDPGLLGRAESSNSERFPEKVSQLINHPEIISSLELKHHGHGPGDRYLMLDNRVVSDARQYCIVRSIPELSTYGEHVDPHRHQVDSLFLFLGNGENLVGLKVEVCLGDEKMVVESPSSVFIPSGLEHSYRVLSGSGLFINHVLEGDYNSSLLDGDTKTRARAVP